ncbi:MAG: hypothetical protein JWQ19_949 [Subtercola sp.]|nr:hypothetical protein [Subtercola sp.]
MKFSTTQALSELCTDQAIGCPRKVLAGDAGRVPHFTSLSPHSRLPSASPLARRPARRIARRRRDASAPPTVPGYDLIEVLATAPAPAPGWAPGSRPVSVPVSVPDSMGGSSLGSSPGSLSAVVRYLAAPSDSPHPEADRVVVSVYPPDAAAVALERARLWQRLDSAHCPQFLDEVELASGTAVVTPWLSCGSLEALLERRRLRVGEAVTILVPLAQLLARLHTLGAAHGDVRASTVYFDERATPVLLGWSDFVAVPAAAPDARPDAVRDAETHAVSGAMPPFAKDAREFVALSRKVLGRSLLDSERLRDLLAAEFAVGTAEVTAKFFREAEQALFALGDARPIDPLVPYDWGAESSQALARVDAAVRSDVEKLQLARSPRARMRSARAVVMQTVVAAPRALLAASGRVRRAGGVRLWPGSRSIVRLKTLGIAATVCAVAVIGALVATPTSTTSHSSSASQFISAAAAGSLPSGSPSAGMPPDGMHSAGMPSAGTPSGATPAAAAPTVITPPPAAPSAGTPPAGMPAAGTPAEGAPTAGTPAAGAPAAGAPAAGTPAAGAPPTASSANVTSSVEAAAPSTSSATAGAATAASPAAATSTAGESGASAPSTAEIASSAPAPAPADASPAGAPLEAALSGSTPSPASATPGAVAAETDSALDAAVSGDDPAAALVALLQRRDSASVSYSLRVSTGSTNRNPQHSQPNSSSSATPCERDRTQHR